jgi:hypothetical protein
MMKRWLLRRLWPYIAQQLRDVAAILHGRWTTTPPANQSELCDDLQAALEWVLLHGRPPDEY